MSKEKIEELVSDPGFRMYILKISLEVIDEKDINKVFSHLLALAEVSMEYYSGELV